MARVVINKFMSPRLHCGILYHDPFGDSDVDSGGMVQSLLVYRIVYMRFLGLRLPKNHVRTVSHRLPQQTLQALVCHLSES